MNASREHEYAQVIGTQNTLAPAASPLDVSAIQDEINEDLRKSVLKDVGLFSREHCRWKFPIRQLSVVAPLTLTKSEAPFQVERGFKISPIYAKIPIIS